MMKTGCILSIILTGIAVLGTPEIAEAQQSPDPHGAFLRSLVLPGWGHFYADQDNRTRGQIHLGAEITLIASYFGFRHRASNLETQYTTLANLRSGVDISDRNRAFQLAIGEFNTLHEYNDVQLRSRNWNRMLSETTENNWQWKSDTDRETYNRLRSDRERVRNQLPAILGLMAVNRVFSAISAYNRANTQQALPHITLLPVLIEKETSGILAAFSFQF